MTALWLVLLMAAAPGAPAGDSKAAPEFKGPAQAARGRVVFLDESKSTHCSGCHALAHAGMAVGPDLSRLARLNPRAIVMAIRSTRTQYVQLVKLQDGSELLPVAFKNFQAAGIQIVQSCLACYQSERSSLPRPSLGQCQGSVFEFKSCKINFGSFRLAFAPVQSAGDHQMQH